MKQLQFAVGLLATVASCSLYAQTMNARANIPFDFRVGEKLLPAGEYWIQQANGWLAFHERDGRHASAVALTQATDVRSEKPVIQFNRYGDAYFLEKLSIPGSSTGRAVMKTPRETELARAKRPGQTTIAFESK
jgi:hypothetical protein